MLHKHYYHTNFVDLKESIDLLRNTGIVSKNESNSSERKKHSTYSELALHFTFSGFQIKLGSRYPNRYQIPRPPLVIHPLNKFYPN